MSYTLINVFATAPLQTFLDGVSKRPYVKGDTILMKLDNMTQYRFSGNTALHCVVVKQFWLRPNQV